MKQHKIATNVSVDCTFKKLFKKLKWLGMDLSFTKSQFRMYCSAF